VLEAFLEGREVSLLTFLDGKTALPMPLACDHKRAEDGNRGPNTGGMGAYSPASWVSADVDAAIREKIYEPVLEALRSEGIDYRGVLYFGVMVTPEGPWVLEFNVRLGDPETQVLLPLLKTDLAELMLACAEGRLSEVPAEWSEQAACGVVVASRGYPGPYERGVAVPDVAEMDDLLVFHAGTAQNGGGHLVSAGGRLLTVVGLGDDLAAARTRVYDALGRHNWSAFHYRRDIGKT